MQCRGGEVKNVTVFLGERGHGAKPRGSSTLQNGDADDDKENN